MPFRAQTIRGYLQGMHQLYLVDPAVKTTQPPAPPPVDIEIRFKYNQDFDSIYAMVPSIISLLLALFPAILMALAIVREKELGSITNLYVTPVTRMEFLLGKQLPYVVVAMVNFGVMFLMALFIFQVPMKGSFLILLLAALIYVTTTTDLRAGYCSADECVEVYFCGEYSAKFPARYAGRTAAPRPGGCRRYGDDAGGPGGRLFPADHYD
jgi:ribosome-dependent ATPase